MQIIVKPKSGMIVRDPRGGAIIPAGGKRVNPSTYWMRRLEAGDVELGTKKTVDKNLKTSAASVFKSAADK